MTLNLRDWSEEKESLDREKNPKNPKGRLTHLSISGLAAAA